MEQGAAHVWKKIGILDVFGLFKETASFVTLKCTINENISLWQHEMSLLCFIFVFFCLNLVHCGNRWVGGCGAAARRVGITGFFSCNPGCVCVPALRIQLTPRHCLGKREQEQSTVYSSHVRLCTALLSLSAQGSCGWYIPDNEWELG